MSSAPHNPTVRDPLSLPALLFLSLALAGGLCLLHWRMVDYPDREFQAGWHAAIIANQGPYPEQYRFLTFFLAEGLVRLGLPLTLAHSLLRLAFTVASLAVLYRYLRAWFSPMVSLLGYYMFAAVLPFSYMFYGMQVTDPLNMLCFFLALWAIRDGRDNWLYPIVAVGMLNRETVILIPIIYAAVRFGGGQTLAIARSPSHTACGGNLHGSASCLRIEAAVCRERSPLALGLLAVQCEVLGWMGTGTCVLQPHAGFRMAWTRAPSGFPAPHVVDRSSLRGDPRFGRESLRNPLLPAADSDIRSSDADGTGGSGRVKRGGHPRKEAGLIQLPATAAGRALGRPGPQPSFDQLARAMAAIDHAVDRE